MPWDCPAEEADEALAGDVLADEACADDDAAEADAEADEPDEPDEPDDEAAFVPHPASAKHAATQIAAIAIALFMTEPPCTDNGFRFPPHQLEKSL